MRAFAQLIVGIVLSIVDYSRSEAAQAADPVPFDPIASVVMHPRCMNCHQDESPRQTDAAILHRPLVVRGKDGHGAPTQPCQTCHQATNTADGFVPGVATWELAPLSMLWEGRTKQQICEQMKDPARNGGRPTGEEVIEHMKVDPLVLWLGAPAPAARLHRSRTRSSWKRWKPGSAQACRARRVAERSGHQVNGYG